MISILPLEPFLLHLTWNLLLRTDFHFECLSNCGLFIWGQWLIPQPTPPARPPAIAGKVLYVCLFPGSLIHALSPLSSERRAVEAPMHFHTSQNVILYLSLSLTYPLSGRCVCVCHPFTHSLLETDDPTVYVYVSWEGRLAERSNYSDLNWS